MPDDDSDWEGEGVPMTRLAYLRILVEGYRAIGAVIPTELRREHDELATAEAERLAKIAAKEAEERQERLDRLYGQEKSLESWWNMQRQYGRTEAAKKWVDNLSPTGGTAIQAAMASAVTFSVGAVLPLLIVLLVPVSALMWAVLGSSLLFLALLGSLAARAGGASVMTAAVRVTFWGALAMALTAGVGALFGVAA